MNLKRCLSYLLITLGGVLCVSCVSFSGKSKVEEGIEKTLTGIDAYKQAGGRISGGEQASGAEGTGQTSISAVGITRNEDIVWAPENPDEAIGGGLDELWKQPESKSWHISYIKAMRQARESGKPVLIWFTNSARSPLCAALSQELFSNSDFDSWAANKLVRLRVDDQISGISKGENAWTNRKNYIGKLKKKYKVHGNPTVIILSPSGGSIAQYRGYKKGYPDYYWGRIKNDVEKAESDYGAWREKLEKRGYRMWINRQGRKTFAKLYRFHSGKVTLIDPDGKRGITSFNKLSDADQTWIIQEKKKHDEKDGR